MNFYRKYKQRTVKVGDQFPNVKLISHHIPKTAGTSFLKTLNQAFKDEKVWPVHDQDLCNALVREEPIWVPSNKEILHGHFPARPYQFTQFPKAKHITWVRDPIDRAWSNLRHWIANESGVKFPEFKAKYMVGGDKSLAELFDNLVRDPYFHDVVRVYKIAFKAVKPVDFQFIGQSENYDSEIIRLSDILNVPLVSARENESKIDATLPFKREDYIDIFASEYEFLKKWCALDYGY